MDNAERDAAGSWAVHRQDDNGNRFVVRAGLDREEAIRLASELEARGHKQLYWIEAEPAAVPDPYRPESHQR
jgi:hypothetical protein